MLTVWREEMKERPGPKTTCNYSDNVTVIDGPERGNTKAYTLSRLKRESPELFQAVCDGELSANAAAIKAGFRKKLIDNFAIRDILISEITSQPCEIENRKVHGVRYLYAR